MLIEREPSMAYDVHFLHSLRIDEGRGLLMKPMAGRDCGRDDFDL
jgi:hypothetical protein